MARLRGALGVSAALLAALLMVALPASAAAVSVPVTTGALAGGPGPSIVRSGPSTASSGSVPGPESSSSSCPISGLVRPAVHAPLLATSSGAGGLSAHSVDPAAVPNTGFSYNLTSYRMPTGNGSFLLTEQEVIGGQILAVGFFSNNTFTQTNAIPFWAVIDNSTGHVISCGYSLTAPLANQAISFEALNTGGRTWEVLYRGAVFPAPGSNNITMNGSAATWTGGLGIVSLGNWSGNPWVPSQVNITDALKVRTSGGWYLPHPVVASWNGTRSAVWGEAGTLQRAYLPPGALQVGTAVATVANGTALWSTSAPTHLSVSVSASPASVASGGTSALVVQALAAGVPIPGLSVSMTSDAGGSFAPAFPWTTNAAGISYGNFTAPLASSSVTALLTANVGNALYAGSGTLGVPVAPTTLTVTASLSSATVATGGLVNLTVTVRHGSTGLAGVNLTLTASVGGGTFSPAQPWTTDANGLSLGSYRAPATPGEVVITIDVQYLGFTGSTVAFLNVTGSGSGTSGATDGTFVIAADAALALLLVVLAYAYFRAPRRGRGPAPSPASEAEAEPASTSTSTSTEEKGAEVKAEGPACPACGKDLGSFQGRFCPDCGAPLSSARRSAD